ncbi:hypothetical protein DFH05DRAFT_846678 [Lentinula detonsa]|uniref:Uncharacterized protein n=1 Tax=Lentinula detonsa TaxID=2804962 RepID=A0A9W8P6B7_9AGAR|nr:hypothetical protein DFH05DRAFT_846678 [Lentinula detonsa]
MRLSAMIFIVAMSLGVMSYPMALSTRYEDPSFRQLGPRMPAPLRGGTRLGLMRWIWKGKIPTGFPDFNKLRGKYFVIGPDPTGSIEAKVNEFWAICVGSQCFTVEMGAFFAQVANFHLFFQPELFRQHMTDLGAEVDWSTPEKKDEDISRFKQTAASSPHILLYFNTVLVDLLERGRLHAVGGGEVLTQLPIWNAHYNAFRKVSTVL